MLAFTVSLQPRSSSLLPTTKTTLCPLSHTQSRNASHPITMVQSSPVNRRSFMIALAASVTAAAVTIDSSAAGEVQWTTVTEGKGPKPMIGDLVGIRFKGSYNGVVFDNLFESSEPYFYRVGSSAVLPGIDETVMKMQLGQVVEATIPSDKAFGAKGRRASPGKPTIPANAIINYTIELSTIPGKEDELLEGLSDSEIGSSLL